MTRWSQCCAVVVLFTLPLFASDQTGTADGRMIPSAIAPASGNTPVIVQFREAPLFARGHSLDERFQTFENDLARIDRARVASNATASRIEQRYSRVFAGAAVSVSGDAIDAIRKLDYVRSVHLDLPVHTFLEQSVPKIKAPEVWAAYGTRGKDVVVAIIDTGIDYNHPALGGGFGAGHRVMGGWDFVNNDADPIDDAGHGTHVAAIVGGNGGGITGVAPEVSFLAYKVLDANGSGNDSTILAALERVADPNGDGNPEDHADVANMSLGRPGSPNDPVSEAVEVASNAGVIFCIATGNAGSFNAISTPANAPSAISVGATTIDDEMATFSSKGPVDTTFAIKPEVVAPGVGIVSARRGGGTAAMSGTSMATPHIAGVAALLRAIHPDWPGAHIKAAIAGTAEALGNEVMAEGAGRVDALRAAGADVVVAQSVLSLGRDDVSQTHWTTTRTLTFVNHGTTARTLTIEAPSSRAEITIALDAASITLAPGESRDVQATFTIDNVHLPSPTEGSLAIDGAIQISGGAMPLHVPWAFVKAATVTIQYDGDDPFEAFVASTQSRAFTRVVGDIGQHTATGIVPAGEYDVKLTPFPVRGSGDITRRFIVVERQTVTDALTVPIRKDMAAHTITPSALDENGQLLDDLGRHNGTCQNVFIMMWPQGSALALSSAGMATYEPFRVSTLSDRFTLLPFQRCIDFGRYAAYSAQLAPIRGVTASMNPTLAPSEWTRVPLRLAISPDIPNPKVGISPAWLWHGANWTFTDSIVVNRPPNGPVWNGTLFLTKEQHPTVNASAFVIVDMTNPDNPALPRVFAFRSPQIRRTNDGVIAWPYLTNAPTTYVAAPGEELMMGEGLMYPETSLWIEHGQLLTGMRFYGTLGEERTSEVLGTHHVLRDEAGNVVQSADTFLGSVSPAPGIYAYEMTKAQSRLDARFDTRLTDGAPPSLTSLRLLDASERNVSRVKSGSAATLLFSAMDRVPLAEGGAKRAAVRAEKTLVRWKTHDSGEWHSVNSTIVATEIANGQAEFDALGHVPVGTVFRCDLSDAANAGAALIDLSLHVEDVDGNSYEWTIAPAFVVESGRRRTVRH